MKLQIRLVFKDLELCFLKIIRLRIEEYMNENHLEFLDKTFNMEKRIIK